MGKGWANEKRAERKLKKRGIVRKKKKK